MATGTSIVPSPIGLAALGGAGYMTYRTYKKRGGVDLGTVVRGVGWLALFGLGGLTTVIALTRGRSNPFGCIMCGMFDQPGSSAHAASCAKCEADDLAKAAMWDQQHPTVAFLTNPLV